MQLCIALAPSASTHLLDAVRDTGTKDAISQVIIDKAVRLGINLRQARTNGRRMTNDEVHATLVTFMNSFGANDTDRKNPCLFMKGMLHCSKVSSADLQVASFKGLDVHKDTPTEILHTVLLGVVKYFWGQTFEIMSKQNQIAAFNAQLNSLSPVGLNISGIQGNYMCHYWGGLIGRHFKIIAQVMVFATMDLVDDDHRRGWLLIGQLVVLLWRTDIEELETYLVCY
jgi:hypothetical protein